MEAQNNNPSCADQVEEFNELQGLTLSYIDQEMRNNNMTNESVGSENT